MESLDSKVVAALLALAGVILSTLIGGVLTIRKLNLEVRKLTQNAGDAEKQREIEVARLRQSAEDADRRHMLDAERLAGSLRDLDLKQKTMEREFEAARQALFANALARRMDAYAALYPVLQRHNRIKRWEGQQLDRDWAAAFIRDLHEVNAEHGVFFSEEVYRKFGELRIALYDLEARLRNGGEASPDELERIDAAISGPLIDHGRRRGRGLGTFMKDELGSYRRFALSALHQAPDIARETPDGPHKSIK